MPVCLKNTPQINNKEDASLLIKHSQIDYVHFGKKKKEAAPNLKKAMSPEKLHKIFLESKGICTDTRKEVEGSLFFALKGENFDGNRFVEDAVAKGCLLAVTERKEVDGKPGFLYVADALKTLQDLAHHHRMQANPQVLAITGSNGKTTTKELIREVLSTKYTVLATRGNLNNHIGVPLTLLSLKKEEIAIVEMGANHAGEIAELAKIAAPTCIRHDYQRGQGPPGRIRIPGGCVACQR
jgi:UDP-N-acetylmuramyl pentapeptide synthase